MLRPIFLSAFAALSLAPLASAQDAKARGLADPFFQKYQAALPAPLPGSLVLKKGDRLAICGDSITEQKQYSALIEMYLTVCVPQLEVTCRQHGWSGEKAGGFAGRMANDALRFRPTVATSCYGMNDHRYTPYQEEIGAEYRKNMTEISRQFREAGVRFIPGAPGTIHSVPGWVKSATGTWEDLNLSLLQLRNIGVELARKENLPFADTFWNMLEASRASRQKHGENFAVEGKDGVHPAWAGQTIMAYGFLRAMGLDGEVGSITWTLGSGQATATDGHEVVKAAPDSLTVRSSRFPILPGPGDVSKDDNIRAGFALAPFHESLNRFTLKAPDAKPGASYTLAWGSESHDYSGEQLAAGINLAAEFTATPLDTVYGEVWKAIAAKQAYETRQMKELMHGPEGKADMEGTVAVTEKAREKLAAKVKAAFKPAEHTLTLKLK